MALRAALPAEVAATVEELPPESYLGRPHETVDAALTLWRKEI
jgi:3-carboxy-cis,cis-muconate cycloisomerase